MAIRRVISKESQSILNKFHNNVYYTKPLGDDPYDTHYRLSVDITPGNNLYKYFRVNNKDDLKKILHRQYFSKDNYFSLIKLCKKLSVKYSEHTYDIEP